MDRILIVDDEASICWTLRESLADQGLHVETAATAEEGLRLAGQGEFDVLLLDVRLPGLDGLSALAAFRERLGPAPVVVMTAFGSLETAVRAMDGGAFDYLVKPFDLDAATAVVDRALEARRAAPAAATEAAAGSSDAVGGTLVGSSPPMQRLYKAIALAAASDAAALVTGESGTGKEEVARAIHRHGRRRTGAFVPVSLAALSPSLIERELFGHVKGAFTGADADRPGLLELAHGGTAFLDEIGDAPAALQVKLLRAIERREVTPVGDARPRPIDIRVIAATHRPLVEQIRTGAFREDLYFRLSVFPIHVPPLRERREDVAALAEHFLRRSAAASGPRSRLTPEALAALESRPWPGNVRELANAVEHAAIVARGGPIRPEHFPPVGPTASPESSTDELAVRLAEWARDAASRPGEAELYERLLGVVEPPVLRAVLDHCRGNRAAAADVLGIHRGTLRQKLRRYGVDPDP
jgi:two-component system nitrogen regulation response regulator GlnG